MQDMQNQGKASTISRDAKDALTSGRRKNTTVISWEQGSHVDSKSPWEGSATPKGLIDSREKESESAGKFGGKLRAQSVNDKNSQDSCGVIDPQFVAYLDDSRKAIRMCPTMVTLIGPDGTLDIEKCKKVSCFWCRHRCVLESGEPKAFDETSGESNTYNIVGCPTRYVPPQIERVLTSPITKEKYSIKENIPRSLVASNENVTKDYYETDGVFCSYQCCLAYIVDNKQNPMYSLSRTLLLNMWTKIQKNIPLTSAPPWRMLREYGGSLSIEEFRARNTYYSYKDTHAVQKVPLKPIVPMFEEKRHL
jgi:uncharacterized protein YbaR (Trm112 family)